MGNVLVLMEQKDGKVRTSSLPAVTAARQLAEKVGGQVMGVVIGEGLGEAGQDAARYVAKVFSFDKAGLGSYMAETWAPLVAKAASEAGASHLLATASNLAKDLMPRVAALLNCGMASDIIEVLDAKKFKRPTYAGNAIATVELTTDTVVATVRQTEFEPAEPAGQGEVASLDAGDLDPMGAVVEKLELTQSSRPDLGEAKIVVSGGRGMKAKENFKVLEELTDLLGGALGATRAAVDAGFVPNDLQVGQTGRVVAPDLYIAVGISGAIQHLAGMKGSKVIVAINKDEEAPIFQVADYGLVSKWEDALPPFIEGVKKLKEA